MFSMVETQLLLKGHALVCEQNTLISMKPVSEKALFCMHDCLDVLFEILLTCTCVHKTSTAMYA